MPLALPLLGYRNLIDDAVIIAGNDVASLPVGHLKTEDLAQVWRATAPTWILADFGVSVQIGFTALVRTNLVAADDVRVRVSTVDATGAAGDAYDSTEFDSGVDPRYDGLFVHFFGPVTGRYLRVDLSNATPEAGRWTAGPTWRPTVSYRFNWQLPWQDHSRGSFSEGMSRWTDRRQRQRGFRLTFRGLTHTDAFAELEEIARIAGTSRDILICRDPGSSNLSRDTLWGYLNEVPVLEQITPDAFEANFEIWARP